MNELRSTEILKLVDMFIEDEYLRKRKLIIQFSSKYTHSFQCLLVIKCENLPKIYFRKSCYKRKDFCIPARMQCNLSEVFFLLGLQGFHLDGSNQLLKPVQEEILSKHLRLIQKQVQINKAIMIYWKRKSNYEVEKLNKFHRKIMSVLCIYMVESFLIWFRYTLWHIITDD